MGHCPKCSAALSADDIKLRSLSRRLRHSAWKLLAFACPHCEVILGVQIDSAETEAVVVDDSVRALLAALRS